MPLILAILLAPLPSLLKVAVFRLLGARIGRGARIAIGAVVAWRHLDLGDGARIGALALVHVDRATLGPRARISGASLVRVGTLALGEQAKIGSLVIVTGRDRFFPRSALLVGSNARIFPLCWLECGQRVEIGEDTSLGGGTHVFTHGSFLSYLEGFPFQTDDVVIGSRVYIPWRAFVMPGTRTGDDCVFGAKSLLRGEYPSRCLAVGIPAKVIEHPYPPPVDDQERERRLVEVLSRIAETAASIGFGVVRHAESSRGFHVELSRRGAPAWHLVWDPDAAWSLPDERVIRVLLHETAAPAGPFVHARSRRARLGRAEGEVGALVRRIFHYHGIRLIDVA